MYQVPDVSFSMRRYEKSRTREVESNSIMAKIKYLSRICKMKGVKKDNAICPRQKSKEEVYKRKISFNVILMYFYIVLTILERIIENKLNNRPKKLPASLERVTTHRSRQIATRFVDRYCSLDGE